MVLHHRPHKADHGNGVRTTDHGGRPPHFDGGHAVDHSNGSTVVAERRRWTTVVDHGSGSPSCGVVRTTAVGHRSPSYRRAQFRIQ